MNMTIKYAMRYFYRVIIVCILAIQLAGCLAVIGARAGLTEAMAINLARSAGGTELAIARVAQANIGSVVASEARFMQLAANPLRFELRGPAGIQGGRINIVNKELQVELAGKQSINIINERSLLTGNINTTRHFMAGKEVSFTRYSDDMRKLDFFLKNNASNSFEHVMYGLRNPSSGSVAFFGKNHAYLGRAVYSGVQTEVKLGTVAGLIAATGLIIELNDFQNTPANQSCSDELVQIRRTYFNQGEVSEPVNVFWTNLYNECPKHLEVRQNYMQMRMESIALIQDISQKKTALTVYLKEFPSDESAKSLLVLLR